MSAIPHRDPAGDRGGEKVYKCKATVLDLARLLPLNFKKNGKVTVSE
jgi:hypothetical protein